jgi:hypothetical protein
MHIGISLELPPGDVPAECKNSPARNALSLDGSTLDGIVETEPEDAPAAAACADDSCFERNRSRAVVKVSFT